MNKHGMEPSHARVSFWSKLDPPDKQTFTARFEIDVPLMDENNNPLWLEHPERGRKIDVAALPLGELDTSNPVSKPINTLEFDNFIKAFEGMDCFIVGYPDGLHGPKSLAIWKRGSISTPPDIEIDGDRKFYVDSASRPGMSGAPVFLRYSGVHDDGNPKNMAWGEFWKFIGVYSGRIGDDNLGYQLGVVWREEVIPEIIEGNKKADNPFH